MSRQVTDPERLKRKIRASLRSQGFVLNPKSFGAPILTKEGARSLNDVARLHRIDRAASGLRRLESKLLNEFASGGDLNPQQIKPKLVEVTSGSQDELLFRYASLHWSVPVSSGYGRRLRFVVRDEQNGRLIGIIGLGDPVFSLGARDLWIGWDPKQRATKLRNVMDAFVLGAVPPYRDLLCGKLVALLVTSDQIRAAFQRKYKTEHSRIREAEPDPRLALITTTSALGRSSVYNRLKLDGKQIFQSVGYTKGYGEFHFSNGLYSSMHAYARQNCKPTDKKAAWGGGFRNRREVIKKALRTLGLPPQWLQHGINREVFVVPLARNSREFLNGEHTRLQWQKRSVDDLSEAFKRRWLIPRAVWDDRYRNFNPENLRLWKD